MLSQELVNLLLLISPILLIQAGIAIYALIDLSKRQVVRGPRWVWGVGLLFTAFALPSGLIISAIYLIWGRHPEGLDDPD